MSGTSQWKRQGAGQAVEPTDASSVDVLLAHAAMALVRCQCDDDVYDVIADFMTRLLPDAIVIINEVTPDNEHLLTRRVVGLNESLLVELAELVGFQILGKVSAIVPASRDDMLCGTLSRVTGGLAELAASEIPRAVSEAGTVLLGIQDAFTIGITDGNNAVGSMHILCRSSDTEMPTHAIEALIRHCYSTLASIANAHELAWSAERNRLLIDSMVEGLAVHDIILDDSGTPCDYRFLSVNAAFESLTGLRGEDIIGRTVQDVIPDIEPVWIERYGAVATTGVPARFEDYSSALGKYFGIVAYSPQPGQFAAVFSDITEQRQADEALKRSEEKFKYLFDHSVIAKSLTTLDGEIEVNDAFLGMLGYTREELADGATWQQLTHPDDVEKSTRVVADLLAGTVSTARFTKRYVHKDGSIIWGDVNTALRRDAKGGPEYFMTSILDITERKHAEDELVRMNAELEDRVQERTEELAGMNQELKATNDELVDANLLLEEATSAKSEFLASMSHELRTPLNSIIGFTGILRQGLAGPVTPEQELQLGMVSESGRHLLSLIDDILDLSKIESGTIAAHFQEFDVATLVDRSLELIRPLTDIKGIVLSRSLEPGAEQLTSDPRLVSQILINLLGNAAKFTDAGTISVSVSVENEQMTFAVADTGRGIREEDRSHIMESFFQAEQVVEAKSRGTGLGLSISAQLAKVLGGTLDVTSEFGVGSTFTLRVPVSGPPVRE
ncbi:MAG: PAS domain S-box protein [Actinomycetota bacterium]|jgi:PAS domain S-box-containing protein|nr:PAS domain S-box protein [Actinomycetota bacterium]